MKDLNQDTRCLGRDSNPAPPEYKSSLVSVECNVEMLHQGADVSEDPSDSIFRFFTLRTLLHFFPIFRYNYCRQYHHEDESGAWKYSSTYFLLWHRAGGLSDNVFRKCRRAARLS
jgi:hypothetical protein